MGELDAAPAKTHAKDGSRPWLFRLGLILVLVGTSLLGYVAWEIFGTNYVSVKKHEAIVSEIQQQWAEGGDTIKAAGYGHFEVTAEAGAEGNFAVAAHRVTHGEPLRRMPELQVGDEIIVETRQATYTYVLDSGGDDHKGGLHRWLGR